MLDLLKELLEAEEELLFKNKDKMLIKMRPSSIYLIVLTYFYVVAGIDIFPERFVTPKFLGYIDDVIFVGFTIVMMYGDIGGILNGIPDIKLPRRDGKPISVRKVEVPVEQQSQDTVPVVDDPIVDTDTSDTMETADSITGISTPTGYDVPDDVFTSLADELFNGAWE